METKCDPPAHRYPAPASIHSKFIGQRPNNHHYKNYHNNKFMIIKLHEDEIIFVASINNNRNGFPKIQIIVIKIKNKNCFDIILILISVSCSLEL